jgi:hypothetical protein
LTLSRRPLQRRERLLLSLVLLLVVAGGAWYLALRPAYRGWSSARQRVDARASELLRLSNNLGLKGDVERQLAELPPDTWSSDVEAVTLARFLTQLETLARESKVVATGTRAEGVERERGAALYRVRLSVEGRLPDLIGFMSRVTGEQYPTGIESISLRSARGGDAVDCTVTLVSVRLNRSVAPSGSAASPASPAPLAAASSGALP